MIYGGKIRGSSIPEEDDLRCDAFPEPDLDRNNAEYPRRLTGMCVG